MLEIRPNCELCNCALPPDSEVARICSYECTFCASCVDGPLSNVCPNCGGGFVARPIRPRTEYRTGVSRDRQPASAQPVHSRYSRREISQFVNGIKDIPAQQR
ncbi:MAG: DUF1272 domain-containing protein [Gammaproteobacteria bacterium]|nr:DUF1272 domain-containing protein [Gammaproteobacteria bacterium]